MKPETDVPEIKREDLVDLMTIATLLASTFTFEAERSIHEKEPMMAIPTLAAVFSSKLLATLMAMVQDQYNLTKEEHEAIDANCAKVYDRKSTEADDNRSLDAIDRIMKTHVKHLDAVFSEMYPGEKFDIPEKAPQQVSDDDIARLLSKMFVVPGSDSIN